MAKVTLTHNIPVAISERKISITLLQVFVAGTELLPVLPGGEYRNSVLPPEADLTQICPPGKLARALNWSSRCNWPVGLHP